MINQTGGRPKMVAGHQDSGRLTTTVIGQKRSQQAKMLHMIQEPSNRSTNTVSDQSPSDRSTVLRRSNK